MLLKKFSVPFQSGKVASGEKRK